MEPIATVNSEPTAEGAEKISGVSDQIGGYKYIKIEHYSKFMTTLRKIGNSILDVIQTIISVIVFLARMTPVVFESFAKFPGIFTIIDENYVFMIQSYLADFGLIQA